MPAAFDNNTIYRIQQATEITELVGEYVRLTKKGREMVGLCPFHDDHRPSMFVNPTKQIYKCFACGAGGDAFKFIQTIENISFPQAVERLAERAGIALEKREYRSEPGGIDPNRLAKLNGWVAEFFQKNLLEPKLGKEVRSYLEERNITSEEIRKWRLGLDTSGNRLSEAVKKTKLPTDMFVKTGLLTGQLTDKFENRLIFSIQDVTGRFIAFGARTLDGTGPKYINSNNSSLFDKSNSLYGLNHAKHKIVETQTALVVEGYTDCIMAHKFGFENTVATLGTSFTVGHARLLKRYAKQIVLLFDNDTAGVEAANRALEICVAQHIDIRLAFVGEGKDPCDYLISKGAEGFGKIIDNAINVFDFKYNRLRETFDNKDNLVDNKNAVEQYLQTIASAINSGSVNAIEISTISAKVSRITGLSAEKVSTELDRRVRRIRNYQNPAAGGRDNRQLVLPATAEGTAQKQILEVLLNRPELIKACEGKITRDSFDEPILKQIAELLFDIIKRNPVASLKEVLMETDSVELANAITDIESTGREKGNFENSLNDAIEIIDELNEKKELEKLKQSKNEEELLRRTHEKYKKPNKRNVGMV